MTPESSLLCFLHHTISENMVYRPIRFLGGTKTVCKHQTEVHRLLSLFSMGMRANSMNCKYMVVE